MAFYVGQKVVCVDDGPSRFTSLPTNVKRGEIYTITKVWVHSFRSVPVVLLAEVEPDLPRHECFDGARFRPVVEREYDISIFTAMLNPAKKAAETVALLGFGTVICWGFMLADFLGAQ